MESVIRLVGPERAVEFLGIRLVGINATNGSKLLFTLAFIAAVLLLGALLRRLTRRVLRERDDVRAEFWVGQGIKVVTAVLLVLGVFSVWFDDPARLTTALGLVTAGLAFALQKVVTAVAGYFVILRGRTFNVGDRIVMGGVRGDVIAVDFTQTTIMEMGQPPPTQEADPGRVGAEPRIHRPCRHGDQREAIRRAGVQLQSRLSPISGKRCGCRSPTPPIGSAPSAFCSTPPIGTRSRSASSDEKRSTKCSNGKSSSRRTCSPRCITG